MRLLFDYLITVPSWRNATILEAVWLLSGLVSLVVSLWNVRDAYRDMVALAEWARDKRMHELHFNMLRLVAGANVRDETFRIAVSMLIVAVGFVGVFTPNPLNGTTTLTGLFVTVALVGIAVMTVVRGVLDVRLRRRLYVMAGQRLTRRRRSPAEQSPLT